MESTLPYIVLISEFSARVLVAAAILLRSRGTPTTRLAWLLVLFALPVVGLVAYLMIGEVRLGHRRIKRYRHIVESIESKAVDYATRARIEATPVPHRYRSIAYLA